MEQELNNLLDHAEEAFSMTCRDESGTPILHAKNHAGDSLLHVAVGQQHSDLIRFLVEHGLDINARGDLHETPLLLANSLGYRNIVNLLLELGADPNLRNYRGETPELDIDA